MNINRWYNNYNNYIIILTIHTSIYTCTMYVRFTMGNPTFHNVLPLLAMTLAALSVNTY